MEEWTGVSSADTHSRDKRRERLDRQPLPILLFEPVSLIFGSPSL
ncbi:hypothetical protein MycrhN_0736 [Mycolicibacterium rhodesiae NBB3]|uniref:Uncharacterized protein n=1 Tax=Mycolicibacterium rhodesiae (strain NBB3) TaxID=710685 RepID=G8RPK5_MYCRN|nr:hypothetical protein MycrhN_0736 [Mycolicibacterium rhodesiae NBB3]